MLSVNAREIKDNSSVTLQISEKDDCLGAANGTSHENLICSVSTYSDRKK